MAYIKQASDNTNTLPPSYVNSKNDFTPSAGVTFSPGLLCNIFNLSTQQNPTNATVRPSAASAKGPLAGVVDPAFSGFDNNGNYVSNQAGARGTDSVPLIVQGYTPQILVDQSGANAQTIVKGTPLIPSSVTVGACQGGLGATVAGSYAPLVGHAELPASADFGYSLTAASLAQAHQTATVGATPAPGDILTVTLLTPYLDTAPGTSQTTAFSTAPLTTAQAVSTTTAATALKNALNANAQFARFFVATSSSAVVTVTVNALYALFHVNFATASGALGGAFDISLAGMLGNNITIACAVSAGAGSTLTAGSTTLASGTGFLGFIPAYLNSLSA